MSTMYPTGVFIASLQNLLVQTPVILVCAIGLVMLLMRRREAPNAAIWAIYAFMVALLLCGAVAGGQLLLNMMMSGAPIQQRATMNTVLAVFWSIIRAVSYILLLVAVFADRPARVQN